MSDTHLTKVFINFSRREVVIMDNEGNDKTVSWKWDDEGSEGFSETVAQIQNVVDEEMITYCLSVK